MNEKLKIILEELERPSIIRKPWDEWYERVGNLVTCAKDIAKEHEDWPVYNILNIVEEMICDGQGVGLEMFLKELSSDEQEEV